MNKLIERLKQYIGKRVEINYLRGRYAEWARGTLTEVNEEYVELKDVESRDYDSRKEAVIRTPFIVSVAPSPTPLISWDEEEEEEG